MQLSSADTDRVSRLAALAVCAVAGALCIWLLLRVIWLFVPRADSATAPPVAAAPGAASAATSIAQWHLFGNPQSVDLAARARTAPKTTLDLVLRGTFASGVPHEGIAIIAQGAQRDQRYSVGEDVGNAKLVEVFPDHVVLAHDGVSEILEMPRPDDRTAQGPATTAARPGASSSVPPGYAPAAAAPGSNSVPPAPAGAGVLARTNAADLARDVRFEPVFDNGHVAGARLSGSGAAGALMNQVGLRPTDIVTAVNGTAISTVSNPQQLVEQFGNASSLQVTIQRDGRPLTLTLNLR